MSTDLEEYSFVIDADGKPLSPTKKVKAWYKIRKKQAKLISKYPMVIQLNKIIPEKEVCNNPIHLGIDDGSLHVGLAIVQECQTKNKVLLKGVIEHRQDVKRKISIRKEYRQHRRYHKRYRPARFSNRLSSRRNAKVYPSILQKKQAIIRVIKFLSKYIRISDIHLEDTAFDIRAMTDGYKPYKWQYQKSNRLDENIRKAVILRDSCKCQLCGKRNCVLEVHHITPRRSGGSNTLSNLITLCKECHALISKSEILYTNTLYQRIYGRNKFELKYANHVMQGKNWLQSELGKLSNLYITNGGETANKRIDWNIEKSHSNDAICITGLLPDNVKIKEWIIKPMRRKNKAKTDGGLGFKHRDLVYYKTKKGIDLIGYITAMRPSRNEVNIQAKDKHFKGANARKCKLLWRFNKIYWL